MTQPTPENIVVDMQPTGRRIDIEAGPTLLEAAQEAAIGLVSLCGGDGWCQSCRIRVISGEVNSPTQNEIDFLDEDALANGYRLACQTIPQTDIRIDIPPESLSTPQRLQVEAKNSKLI